MIEVLDDDDDNDDDTGNGNQDEPLTFKNGSLIEDITGTSCAQDSKATRLIIEDITPTEDSEEGDTQDNSNDDQSRELLSELAEIQESLPAKKGVIGAAEETQSIVQQISSLISQDEEPGEEIDDELEGLD